MALLSKVVLNNDLTEGIVREQVTDVDGRHASKPTCIRERYSRCGYVLDYDRSSTCAVYVGPVQPKNFLSVLMQCFTIASVMSILWLAVRYAPAFGDRGSLNALIGGLDNVLLA